MVNKEIACHDFPEPKVTSSDYFFYTSNSSKPKDTQFTLIYGKEKQQILRSERLEPADVWQFGFKS